MTHEELDKIVIKVANNIDMRYWRYWNYPYQPQKFAIGFFKRHDHGDGIAKYLESQGFKFAAKDRGYQFYTIERTES